MATSVASVVSHFPEAENGFTTTTAGSVSSGATTVTLNSVSGYTNGEPVVLVIDPTDPTKKQTFTGIVDTAGVQITSVVWTAGTNQTHALGATVVDYATATHISMVSKGIKVEHSQDGTHKAALITSRTEDTNPDHDEDFVLTYDTSATALKKVKLSNLAGAGDSWVKNVLPAVSSVTENGNRSADITFASTVASILTPGMRIRTSRTVAAPTYVGGLFNGTTHYFTKVTPTSTLSTVTNNFTLMGFVEPTAYAQGTIAARADVAVNNSISLMMEATGVVRLIITNTAAANFRYTETLQSLPLNKRTHVAASWSSGTVVIYFDGISVPVSASVAGGTAPTVASTGGDFSIGRRGAAGAYFTGYISGFGAFNAVLSAATIRSYIPQVLSGAESNCIGAWSLNNTGVNQQAAGTNDLTATGGVGYTVRAPYTTDANGTPGGTYDYAIVTKVATTVATVQYPEGCAIPTSGGISAVDYSGVKAPFGMPVDSRRWRVESLFRVLFQQASPVASTWYNLTSVSGTSGGTVHVEPVGEWRRGYEAIIYSLRGVSGTISHHTGLSTANNTAGDSRMMARSYASTILDGMHTHKKESPYSSTSATTLYLNTMTDATSVSSLQLFGNTADTIIYSDLAYL